MKNVQKISFDYRGKKFSFDAKICGFFDRALGLMFKPRKNAQALLFKFDKSSRITIHSLFVFFPFVVAWLDSKGKIIEIRKIKPFTPLVSIEKSYSLLIEIPINKKYSDIVKLLVGD